MTVLSKLASGIAIVIAVATAGLFVFRSRPVLYSVTETGDPVNEPVWSLLNPLRDRVPERAAEAVLGHLLRGDCSRAVAEMKLTNDRRSAIAKQEYEHPLRSFRLINRSGVGTTTRLFYRITRARPAEADSPLWIDVRRSDSGDLWEVTRFETWY